MINEIPYYIIMLVWLWISVMWDLCKCGHNQIYLRFILSIVFLCEWAFILKVNEMYCTKNSCIYSINIYKYIFFNVRMNVFTNTLLYILVFSLGHCQRVAFVILYMMAYLWVISNKGSYLWSLTISLWEKLWFHYTNLYEYKVNF